MRGNTALVGGVDGSAAGPMRTAGSSDRSSGAPANGATYETPHSLSAQHIPIEPGICNAESPSSAVISMAAPIRPSRPHVLGATYGRVNTSAMDAVKSFDRNLPVIAVNDGVDASVQQLPDQSASSPRDASGYPVDLGASRLDQELQSWLRFRYRRTVPTSDGSTTSPELPHWL